MPSSPAPGAVLLDVDGTLVDTVWLHVLAWSRALRSLGVDVPMSRLHPLVGMGADRFVSELLGREVPGAGDAHHDEFVLLRPDVRCLPGARDLVRTLHERGLIVVLASSSEADELDFFREVLDVDDWLEAATSSSDASASKPSPDIFAAALERAGTPADRAVVVGDTVWDVQAAQKLGVASIGLLTGGARARELEAEGAAATYADPAALVDDLADSPIGRLMG
ncbi:MAG: putative haloacid dehalogenase-like hydrolase [Acidimicrobiales bacterium]|nr:putative haloacid dehalogenase-like hydrolase [Acidimicrobiales bacterium]